MAKPFDAVLKGMLEQSPLDWPALAGHTAEQVEVIDADVSTYTGAADKVLRIAHPGDWIMHVDFQAGPDASLPRRLHVYNALLEDRHDRAVRSVLVLLRPEADLSRLTGLYERSFGTEVPYLAFRYQVIRIWRLAPGPLLSGGLGTLPLAPISAVSRAELPSVVERMQRRLRGRARQSQAAGLWAATYILMGLRYEQALVNQLLGEVLAMEESVTYQAIIAKGMERGAILEAKKTILVLGQERFGSPPAKVRAAIEAIEDLERLEQLSVRLLRVDSWNELLTTSNAGPRKSDPEAELMTKPERNRL